MVQSILIYLHFFFFFNVMAPTELYTLSLHDALPIFSLQGRQEQFPFTTRLRVLKLDRGVIMSPPVISPTGSWIVTRSEEHTSELQSRENLVCRLLLEKKKQVHISITITMCNSSRKYI